MKSFLSLPTEFDKALSQVSARNPSGKPVAHIELFKQVVHLPGCVIKCGISTEEGLGRLGSLKQYQTTKDKQAIIAFEKPGEYIIPTSTSAGSKTPTTAFITEHQKLLMKKAEQEEVQFVPGHIDDTITDFLISNPELRICYLNIDLDSYEMALTALEFLFPRLVEGGVMILDNYFRMQGEYRAVKHYFYGQSRKLDSFSSYRGPHFIFCK